MILGPATTDTLASSTHATVVLPDQVARFTIEQYEQMIDAGVFDSAAGSPRQRVELLEGVLTQMSPIKEPHAAVVDELNYWAIDHFDRQQYRVRVQGPVQFPPATSVPEPDVTVLKLPRQKKVWPSGREVALMIEVSDTTLVKDLGYKANLYAAGGVPEYWVVDIPNHQVHVHRLPTGDAYSEVTIYQGDQKFVALGIAEGEQAAAETSCDQIFSVLG